MKRRFTLETTLYGKRSVTREQLYRLHREVSRAASEARLDDPLWLGHYTTGKLAAQGRHA